MTNRPRNIGTAAETAVVKVLRANGFGGADRSPLRGSADQGDITGCPGLVFEVKGGEKARAAEAANVVIWVKQAEVERRHAGADLGILVIARRGYGPLRADKWWAVTTASAIVGLYAGTVLDLRAAFGLSDALIWLELGDLIRLLRFGGYGDPLDETFGRIETVATVGDRL